jgi:Ran GTPase-activating protein (RanGAP) involved in mRNA processing and transport
MLQSGVKSKKKVELTTDFDEKKPNHMVQSICLSNFHNTDFSRAAFREFLESIADMRCLETLILRNNGIDDTYVDELEIIFSNPRITHIDLSGNLIDKQGALVIGKCLKEGEEHLKWLDLSRNKFNSSV